jgi:hypothetical protein
MPPKNGKVPRQALASIALAAAFCGCVGQAERVVEAAPPPKVYFQDDFSGGMQRWIVKSSGGGSFALADNKNLGVSEAAQMRSQLMKSATAEAPEFAMEWGSDYTVYFDFMLQHRDNYGYTVYADRNAQLTLGEASGIFCGGGLKRQLTGRIETNGWHQVRIEVKPSEGAYDVFIDGERTAECPTLDGGADTFLLGDPDPTEAVHGDGLWDNFRIAGKPQF